MTDAYKKISRGIKGSITDRLRERSFSEIERFKVTLDRMDKINEVEAKAIGAAIDALHVLNNSLTAMSAGMSHNLEEVDELKSIVIDMSNTASIVASLKAIIETDDEFWDEALKNVRPQTYQRAMSKQSVDRQIELGGNYEIRQE